MASFGARMVGAAKLDAATYEEVEHDAGATGQAAAVVILSSVAGGIAVWDELGFAGLIAGTVGSLVGWFVWAFVTYIVGTRILPGPDTEADTGQLLRTLGFSSSPGLLQVFGVIPMLGGIVLWIASFWMLAAMVVAVRQALDYESTWRAIAVCIFGFVAYVLSMFGLAAIIVALSGGTPGGP